MKMSKVGNQTNSLDPQAVNSRTFVGNLNTFQCSKQDVERMFQRYGRIAGISMHKGYAFVQFTNPFDARSACLGEDGRTVLGQILDVNMVAEPKPHQTGRKRQNVSKTGNDWDYYYDSYYASAAFMSCPPRLVPPLKRPRLMTQQSRPVMKTVAAPVKTHEQFNADLNQLKTYSNPDILICGNCREMFTDVYELVDHKKTYCKLRFTCKCHTLNGMRTKSSTEDLASITTLLCVTCKEAFQSAWDLLVHVQAAHMINIYELGVPKEDRATARANHKEHEKKNGREGTPNMDDDDIIIDLSSDDIPDSPELDKMDDSNHEKNTTLLCPKLEKMDESNDEKDMILASTELDKIDESIHEKDLVNLLAVESTAQACIMHALRIEQENAVNSTSVSVTTDQPSAMVSVANGD